MKNPFNIHCWSPICRNLNDVVVLLNNLPISDSWWTLPLLPPQHATHNPTHSHSTFPLLSLPFQRNHHLDSNSSPYNNFPSFGTGFSRIARVCRAYQTAMWHRNAVCHPNSQQHICSSSKHYTGTLFHSGYPLYAATINQSRLYIFGVFMFLCAWKCNFVVCNLPLGSGYLSLKISNKSPGLFGE